MRQNEVTAHKSFLSIPVVTLQKDSGSAEPF